MPQVRTARQEGGNSPVPAASSAPTYAAVWAERITAYVALTKPRVIEQLLVVTIPAMLLAQRGHVDAPLIFATLFGGLLGAASANAFNCIIDADIDSVMKRTENRPLVTKAFSTRAAVVFATTLGVASFLWFWWVTNLTSAVFILATIAFYVLIYTMVLKRRTSQNVVWGGAAGCMPVVIGWSASTGSVGWPALVMFLIIFFWTPPHTWALAMKYRDDYERAGVPMLPVVAPASVVTRQILIYSWVMVAASLALVPAAGLIYAGIAIFAGACFLIMAHRLHSGVMAGRAVEPMKLFHLSNTYLVLLFVGIALDSVLDLATVAELLGR